MAQAMVTSSLMHASILSSGKCYVDEEAEAEFLHQCLHYAARYKVGHRPPAPQRTFEQHWSTRCESEWRWAFRIFSAGAMCCSVSTDVDRECIAIAHGLPDCETTNPCHAVSCCRAAPGLMILLVWLLNYLKDDASLSEPGRINDTVMQIILGFTKGAQANFYHKLNFRRPMPYAV
jgi:hypothetical protein